MNQLLIGLYAVWMLMVAYKGNSSAALAQIQKDAPGFLPWLVSVIVLSLLYDNPSTQKAVKPFLFLIVLVFVLQNFPTLKVEFQRIYSGATNPTTNATTVP